MPNTLFDLSGRVALLTGSSRGLGLAMARGLADAGATVVLNSRKQTDLDAAVSTLSVSGRQVHALAFDVTDRQAVTEAVERIEKDIGPIDILFNNAGIQHRQPLEEFPEDAWRAIMSTNLDSVFFVGQAVARKMIPRRRGKIVNTCSINSEISRKTIAPYSAAKGAVRMLTRGMCVDWAQYGIQVNGIGPGFFKTELNRALHTNPEFDSWVRTRTPAGRWGEIEELAGVAVFLASDASSYVNGQIVYVDGGLLGAV